MPQPLVSFYVNSYNRIKLLRNLLDSFTASNIYPHVEWIAVDYGSTDGSRDYLREFARSAPFPVKLVIEDANHFPTLFGKFRNDARRAAEGEYFVEVPEDQQFICRRDWVSECLGIFDQRRNKIGRNDISGIVLYGYSRWRLDKPNNALLPEEDVNGSPYFFAIDKPYVDYHMMARETYELVGPYLEPSQFGPDSPLWKKWMAVDPTVRPEQDYQIRCKALGLKRAFLKYPILVSFPNDLSSDLQTSDNGLIARLWTLDEMKRCFGHLNRPVSSDELDPEHHPPLSTTLTSWKTKARTTLSRIARLS